MLNAKLPWTKIKTKCEKKSHTRHPHFWENITEVDHIHVDPGWQQDGENIATACSKGVRDQWGLFQFISVCFLTCLPDRDFRPDMTLGLSQFNLLCDLRWITQLFWAFFWGKGLEILECVWTCFLMLKTLFSNDGNVPSLALALGRADLF